MVQTKFGLVNNFENFENVDNEPWLHLSQMWLWVHQHFFWVEYPPNISLQMFVATPEMDINSAQSD